MVTTLYLVRHGETEGGNEKRYKGSIDVAMSEKGIEQIKKASEFISVEARKCGSIGNKKINSISSELHSFPTSALFAVYCSPLSRALKSAEIIAEPHGLKPVIVSDLRERHFGIWEGMSFDEIRERYPVEFNAWAENPLKYSPMGGESTVEVRDRVIKAVEKILYRAEGRKNGGTEAIMEENIFLKDFQPSELQHFRTNIAIVAHGGVNRVILCHAMGIPLENIFRIEQDYGAVNVIEFWDEYPVIKMVNGGLI